VSSFYGFEIPLYSEYARVDEYYFFFYMLEGEELTRMSEDIERSLEYDRSDMCYVLRSFMTICVDDGFLLSMKSLSHEKKCSGRVRDARVEHS
jgi:hypothetical protein